MDDPVEVALRREDSSLRVAAAAGPARRRRRAHARVPRRRRADGCMRYRSRRYREAIDRPAIATVMPKPA